MLAFVMGVDGIVTFQVLKTVSQIFTYIGLCASSILTWINLHFKTASDPESGHTKTLTPAGKAARMFLILSFILTVTSSVVQNYADSKLRQAAEQRGAATLQAALASQHKLYLDELRQRFEGPTGVIPRLGEQANTLNATASALRDSLTLLRQTRSDISNQTAFLSRIDLRVLSSEALSHHANEVSASIRQLEDSYIYAIEHEAGLEYWDRVEDAAPKEELDKLKIEMQKKQDTLRSQYNIQAAKVMARVRPLCEEMQRRIGSSDLTEVDRRWANELADRRLTTASREMQPLASYLESLAGRMMAKAE